MRVGFTSAQKAVALDATQSVIKCWYKEVEIECGKLFYNHFGDVGWCFTFNPDRDYYNSVSNGDSLGKCLNTISLNRKISVTVLHI